MEYTDAQIERVMVGLGINQPDLLYARTSTRALAVLQRKVKKAYRKLVLDLHPDRTGGDPEKSCLFQLATEVVQEIMGMSVEPRSAPDEPPRRVRWAIKLKARATAT